MEKIFHNGTIYTMDDKQPQVDAVYVKDGRIAATGALEQLREVAGHPVDEVDLGSNVMFPGFIEPHAHFDVASFFSQTHFIGGMVYDTTEEVIDRIKQVVDETPAGKWIFFFGLDYLLNRDFPAIDRHWIDDITTDHPVAIMVQSIHTAFLNTPAIKIMGFTAETEDPRDGHIYKDENGEPNGIITEQTLVFPVLIKWLQDWNFAPEFLCKEQYRSFKEKGITTTWTAGMMSLFPNQLELMAEWGKTAPVRQDYSIAFAPIENGSIDLDKLPENNDSFRFTGIKFWYDGSPYTGNMFMDDNYLENEIMQSRLHIPVDQAGERLFKQDMFYALLEKYHLMGYQISVHSQGDRSNRELIDMFERLLREHPRDGHRHRIEHCAFMAPEDVKRCGELGITLSYHIGHLFYYGEALNELVIGKPRVDAEFMRCRDAIDAGIPISLHSDEPMYFADPLLLASTAISRTTRKGLTMTEDQAISVHEAMRAITIDAAWQLMRDEELGSIEVGKFADFTVLAADPYKTDPVAIKDIPVVTTYLAGADTDTL